MTFPIHSLANKKKKKNDQKPFVKLMVGARFLVVRLVTKNKNTHDKTALMVMLGI